MSVLAALATLSPMDRLEQQARRDFLWACANLLCILPKDAPVSPLHLNWPQRYLAENYFIPAAQRGLPLALSVLKARREGVSTVVAAWHYHKIRWYRGRRAMVYAHDDDSLAELFDMITRFHDYLPEDIQIPTSANNTKELEYAGLDSRVGRRVAGTKDVGRGKTIHHCHLSEVDFYQQPETVMAGVVEAVPSTGPSTLILETTANGDGGWFHDHWLELKKRKGKVFSSRYWYPVFIPWFWNPESSTQPPRGWEPTKQQEDNLLRYRLTRAQAYWHAQKGLELETLNPGRGHKLLTQEYPHNDRECFIQSGDSVFSEQGRALIKAHRRPPSLGFHLLRTGDRQFALEAAARPVEAPFQVWESPQPGYQYALGVDTAHGGGGDDSAVNVMRMPGFRVVAEWYDNETSPGDLLCIVGTIARYYALPAAPDVPYINTEVNDGVGLTVNDELVRQGQEGAPWQPYYWEPFDRLAPARITGATRTGWVTSYISKNVMIGVANLLLGDGLVHIPSATLQAEMERVIEISIGHSQTRGADQVMAWLLALVTCYRKIARWEWPGMGTPGKLQQEDDPQQRRGIVDPTAQDTTYGRILRPRSWGDAWDGAGVAPVGGSWLVE